MFNITRGLLSRLRKDIAGNTLAMAAAALIPLLAAIGGSVDASRFYMATSRLQNACDAGALAARKSMETNVFTSEHRTMGLDFFDHNYPEDTFQLEDLNRNFIANGSGTVTGTASGNLPTTLMQVFGFSELNLDVTCSAEINISNTDILFVLDVTGSMNCPDDNSDPGCGNNGNVEAANAKIKGLRTAVVNFYDVVDDATSDSAQVRYGIVPYSSGINVGNSIPVEHMAQSAAYQTRVPQWDSVTSGGGNGTFNIESVTDRSAEWYHNYWYNPSRENYVYSSSQCQSRANSSSLGYSDNYVDGSIDESTIEVLSESTSGGITTRRIRARAQLERAEPVAWYSGYYGCYIDLRVYRYWATIEVVTTSEEEVEEQVFDDWIYQQHTWEGLGDLYSNGSVVLPTGSNGTDQAHSWDGCIEEAATTHDSNFDPLPGLAYDLNINLIPNAEEQRWKPTLPSLVYRRSNGGFTTNDVRTSSNSMNGPSYFCPKASRRLGDMERSDLVDYLSAAEGFRAIGSTYHDIGMVWGSRFISPRGIFAADNAAAPNGDAIGRHIIFMTDGTLSTLDQTYTPYGTHFWDKRITNSSDSNTIHARHEARFQAICKQARQENISVWVVAFGTSLSQNLQDCATPGRAFFASDSDALEEKFAEIAQYIAALRLTN